MHSANLPKQYVIGLGKHCNTAISNMTNKGRKGPFILALFSFRMKAEGRQVAGSTDV